MLGGEEEKSMTCGDFARYCVVPVDRLEVNPVQEDFSTGNAGMVSQHPHGCIEILSISL